VRALLFERSAVRYGAAVVAGRLRSGAGARVGPLRLADVVPPDLPGPGWHRVRPDLPAFAVRISLRWTATARAISSRW